MKKRGFTLLEILLVVAAIAILAGIVIVAINPGKQLGAARNAARQSDVNAILNSIYQFGLDHNGVFPVAIDTSLRMLGTSSGGCNVSCGGTGGTTGTSGTSGTTATITDSASTGFTGTFTTTAFDTANSILKISSGTSGTYTSTIKDGGDGSTWNTLTYVPNRPINKELPNNKAVETAYSYGNADMTGNVLLMHLNESSGATTFVDSSGSGNDGSCINPNCPNTTTGKFGNALSFSLGSNPVSLAHSASLNLTNQFTLGIWSYHVAAAGWTTYGHLIGKGVGFTPPGSFSISGFNNYWRVFLMNPITNSYEYQDVKEVGYNYWAHIIFTFDNGVGKVYVNNNLISTKTFSFNTIRTNTLPVQIGYGKFNGKIDEVSIFNRALSATEIADQYKRGSTRLKLQARTCADATCSTIPSFVGQDGTSSTYFEDSIVSSNAIPSFSLSGFTGRYLQYKAFLESDSASITPELKSVGLSYATAGTTGTTGITGTGGTNTQDACLDLSTSLAPDYITAVPADPKLGTASKTYYAVAKTAGGRINVQACAAENGEVISVTR